VLEYIQPLKKLIKLIRMEINSIYFTSSFEIAFSRDVESLKKPWSVACVMLS
jgi:hypothetical protein